jgi:ketosteroid isomerase-like protein
MLRARKRPPHRQTVPAIVPIDVDRTVMKLVPKCTIVAALCSAVLLLLASAPSAQAQFSREERTAYLTEQYLTGFNEDFARGKLSDWMALWAEDAVSESSRERWQGTDEIRTVFQDMFDAWDHLRLERERSRLIAGDSVAWQGYFSGRHRKAGRVVSVPAALFLTFDADGKVELARFYIDVQQINDQLR